MKTTIRMMASTMVPMVAISGLLAPSSATAWDTVRNKEADWRSVYCAVMAGVDYSCDDKTTGSFHGGQESSHNEHAEAADDALFYVGADVHAKAGVFSCSTAEGSKQNCPTVVDLNASWLRFNVLDDTPKFQDDKDTALEERKLPPLAMWSGLPDFAYTVYDWINKLTICPPLPKSAPAELETLCWNYSAMLGGSMNSTHMGDLAMKVYRRHHAIAVNEAKRARELYALFEVGGLGLALPNGVEWHKSYVEEGETLALVYELAGQHFLQDRWSSGHMFSRWGSGDYGEWKAKSFYGEEPNLWSMMIQGLVTGIIHGTGALNGSSDPLCHPLLESSISKFGGFEGLETFTNQLVEAAEAFIGIFFNGLEKDTAYVTSWSYPTAISGTNLHQTAQKGVGDHLLESLVDEHYAGTQQFVADVSLKQASNQKKAMRYCAGQGIREVIGAMFEHEDGKRGAREFVLGELEEGYQVLPYGDKLGGDPSKDPLCNSHWVTNESYYAGVRTLAGQVGLAADIMVFAKGAFAKEDSGLGEVVSPPAIELPGFLGRIGGVLTYLSAKARKNMELDEDTFDKVTRNAQGQEVQSRKSRGLPKYTVKSARDSWWFEQSGVLWRPNSHAKLPDYYEPADLMHPDLPQTDNERGRDKDAIAGFFNKAHTEHWCKDMYATLEELRDAIAEPQSDTLQKRDRAVCSYLANRVYKGTDERYKKPGGRHERIGEYLPFDETDPAKKYGETFEPVCAYFDAVSKATITEDASDDDKPYWIHPGYVETPGQKGELGYGPKTIENWCDQIPVIDFTDRSDDDHDSVGRVLHDDGNRWVELTGDNLGIKTPEAVGTVEMRNSEGQWVGLDIWDGHNAVETGGWSLDNQTVDVRVLASKAGFPSTAVPDTLPHLIKAAAAAPYELRLTRPEDILAAPLFKADGRSTVGRYVVEVEPSWTETDGIFLSPGQAGAYWATYPEWLRDKTEILAMGFYRVDNGVYTKLDIVFQYFEGSRITFGSDEQPIVTEDKNVISALVLGDHPDVFDGTVVFFFAYH